MSATIIILFNSFLWNFKGWHEVVSQNTDHDNITILFCSVDENNFFSSISIVCQKTKVSNDHIQSFMP